MSFRKSRTTQPSPAEHEELDAQLVEQLRSSAPRRRRSPLILGALSISAGLALSGCVPSGEDDPSDGSSSSEESQGADESAGASETASEGSSPESSAESSAEASEESTNQSSDDASEDASENASEAASDDPSDDSSEDGGSASATGDVVELSGLPDVEPVQSESGSGDGEFALEHPDGEDAPVYTSRFASGDSSIYAYFTGQRTDGSTTSMGGVVPGTTGVGFEDPYWMDERITDVKVSAEDDVEWQFDVYSIDEIPDVSPGQSVKADGSKVFHWTGEEAGSFDVQVEGDSNFIVKAETADPDGPTAETIFNEIGPGEGTMELPAEEYFITVESSGPWEFTAR